MLNLPQPSNKLRERSATAARTFVDRLMRMSIRELNDVSHKGRLRAHVDLWWSRNGAVESVRITPARAPLHIADVSILDLLEPRWAKCVDRAEDAVGMAWAVESSRRRHGPWPLLAWTNEQLFDPTWPLTHPLGDLRPGADHAMLERYALHVAACNERQARDEGTESNHSRLSRLAEQRAWQQA